jgi:hypothetical protein
MTPSLILRVLLLVCVACPAALTQAQGGWTPDAPVVITVKSAQAVSVVAVKKH